MRETWFIRNVFKAVRCHITGQLEPDWNVVDTAAQWRTEWSGYVADYVRDARTDLAALDGDARAAALTAVDAAAAWAFDPQTILDTGDLWDAIAHVKALVTE